MPKIRVFLAYRPRLHEKLLWHLDSHPSQMLMRPLMVNMELTGKT